MQSTREHLSSIEEIIADARQGKMFILVDDEGRENEGDLVIPAQFADASAINFMAKFGRGLICLSLEKKRVDALKLNLMTRHNESRHETAFTISIEAREGISTGISAADRAKTIAVAIDDSKSASDIVSPGHVFPLVAREGGVLVRAGHTEAAVDISRLAAINPSGVICEIMNDDGSMARLPDLIKFAQHHELKIATIADLIAFRRKREKLVERLIETEIDTEHGGKFHMIVYKNNIDYAEHIVLVKGELKEGVTHLVRMHSYNPLADLLGDTEGGRVGDIPEAMRKIAAYGSGVLVILREPVKTALSDRLRARLGEKTIHNMDLRDYGIGAQILIDLKISEMILLSNSRKSVVGLEGYGLKIIGYETIT